MIPFGERLQKLRSEKGWSQAQLSTRLGVSASQIANYEMERRLPSIQALIDTSHVLGVSTDYLLGISSDSQEQIDISGLTSAEIDSIRSVIACFRNAHRD